VDYRREFPEFSRPELSAPDNLGDFHWKKFYQTILFTKSNDWIYEKEQRIVVPLSEADSITCEFPDDLKKLFVDNPEITLNFNDKGKTIITFPKGYEMNEDPGDDSIKKEIYFSTMPSYMENIYLFRLNPAAISGVFFGCNARADDINDTIQCIGENASLSCLKQISKMEVNKSMYQLDPIKIIEK